MLRENIVVHDSLIQIYILPLKNNRFFTLVVFISLRDRSLFMAGVGTEEKWWGNQKTGHDGGEEN